MMRRIFKSDRFVKLLNLPMCEEGPTNRGLVLIQIDGLSLTQFEHALKKNKMPFIQKLISEGKYHLKPVYSGLPSSTPAFQGELFYGVKTSVPAFEFIDRQESRRHVSFYPNTAEKLARRLEKRGEPLLKNGHAYATLFSGGAAEVRYCSETMNLDSLVDAVNPLKLLVILLLHLGKLLRIISYALIECMLAVTDFFKGVFKGRHILKEFTFIPARIAICAILRELVRFRMKMDIVRGVPIAAANLLGYDEQAHRRGPHSAFAHWSLKGIDDVVNDIYQTAMRAECRNYRVIVYSDHGQEAVVSYDACFGLSVKTAARRLFHARTAAAHRDKQRSSDSTLDSLYHRARSFFLKQWFPEKEDAAIKASSSGDIEITTMGPLGHIYLPEGANNPRISAFAKDLVQKAHIPLALFQDADRIIAVNAAGVFDLYTYGKKIVGEGHPFPNEVVDDLARLCRHPNAGDVVISGWDPGKPPLSFNIENGAHGGPGWEETQSLALLPASMQTGKRWLRALDIRNLIFDYFRKIQAPDTNPLHEPRETALKILSYNIHSCLNLNGRYNPNRTANVIAGLSPHIVALQEVDAERKRSHFIHQAAYLADCLNMTYQFFPIMENVGEKYGLAILSRFPIIDLKCNYLPAAPFGKPREKRGFMMALIDAPLGPIRVFNTHFSLHARDRVPQAQGLLQDHLISKNSSQEPVVLCGDLNAGPRSRAYKMIRSHLDDVQVVPSVRKGHPKSTFFSWCPVRRIDHIFISSHFKPIRVLVPYDYETRMTSDHLPLLAELALKSIN